MTKQEFNKWKTVCDKYKVTLVLTPGLEQSYRLQGYAICHKNTIYVDPLLSDRNQFISCLFHEIQHCLNHRQRKFWNFHKGNTSWKDKQRLALRAEVYTDKQAAKLAELNGFHNFQRTYYFTPYWKEQIQKQYKKKER